MSVTSVITTSNAPCSVATFSGNTLTQLVDNKQPGLKLLNRGSQSRLLEVSDPVFQRCVLGASTSQDNNLVTALSLACKRLSALSGRTVLHLGVDDEKIARDIQRLNALDQAAALIHFASRFPNLRTMHYQVASGSTRILSMFCSCSLPRWKYLRTLKIQGMPVDRHEWLLLVAINCPQLKSLAVVTTLADYTKTTKQIQHLFSSRLEELKITVTKTSKETAAAGFALELKDMPSLTALTLMIHVPAERKSNQRISLHLNGLTHLKHLAILQQNPEVIPKIWGMELALEAAHVPQITSLTIYDLLMQVRLRELPMRFPNLEKLHLLCVDAAYLRNSLPAVLGLKNLKQVKLWPEPPAAVMADWARTMPNIHLSAEKPEEL